MNLRISDDKIFTICLKCNEPLEETVREKVKGRVPPYVYRTKDRFFKCPRCGHLYWRGTHHDLVMGIISKVLELKGDREDHIA